MARPPCRFIGPLSDAQRETLRQLQENGATPRIRQRARAVLLSDRGKTVNEIAEILEVTRESVCAWFDRFERAGTKELGDAPRSGAPTKLDEKELELALDLLKKYPHSPKRVLDEIHRATGKSISGETLRRIAHKARLRWKRMRRTTKDRQDPAKFARAREALDELRQMRADGMIDVRYFDEAGFSLTPSIPYGWLPVGERTEIPSQRSQQLNIVGFLSTDNELTSYTFDEAIDSAAVIACFDDFARTLDRPTVVVLDNASPHTSAEFLARIELWRERNLYVFHLPPYCPELNLIEILWRTIKHHWLPLSAYTSFASLVDKCHETLRQVGEKLFIEFKQVR